MPAASHFHMCCLPASRIYLAKDHNLKRIFNLALGSAPTTHIGSRVGSDFPKTSILKVGSGRVGSVIWSVGGSVFLKVYFLEKNH